MLKVQIFNERLKLIANYLNVLCVVAILMGFWPMLMGDDSLSIISVILGVVLHGAAHVVIGFMKDEAAER